MNDTTFEILLVEDNIDDATLTLRALRKSGLSNPIHHVKDGAEALDFLYGRGVYATTSGRIKPRLVLLDLKMPKLSGTEVLQKIKSDSEFKSIPVVILTSSKEDPDIRKCYELGANSYIVKPVGSETFFEAIKSLGIYWVVLNEPPRFD